MPKKSNRQLHNRYRPWSVHLPSVGRFAAKHSLEECKRLIDQITTAADA